jgi:hypothetical protein
MAEVAEVQATHARNHSSPRNGIRHPGGRKGGWHVFAFRWTVDRQLIEAHVFKTKPDLERSYTDFIYQL